MLKNLKSIVGALWLGSKNLYLSNIYPPWLPLIFLCLLIPILFAVRCDSTKFPEREEKREAQRLEKSDESHTLEQRADSAEQLTEPLYEEIKKLQKEKQDLRAEIARISNERKKAKVKYENKQTEFIAIPDYVELRRHNCELRAKLGFPCPEQ
jgi:septal ring factor EnvC (AmiA/AmiB activator)